MQTKTEIRVMARALAEEIRALTNLSLCEWITEKKALEEFPLTQRQLEKYRNQGELQLGYHYKSLGIDKSKDGSRRGRKTIIYHRNRLIDFVDSL